MSDGDRSEMRDAEYKITQAVAFSTSLAIALNGFGKIAIEPEMEIAALQTLAWEAQAGAREAKEILLGTRTKQIE